MMKKFLLTLLLSSNLSAQTTWLIVPAQYWSDGNWRNVGVVGYYDAPYLPYRAEDQCMMAMQSVSKADPRPPYSMCSVTYDTVLLFRDY